MRSEEALRVTCRLESPHGPLALARRLVGVLSPVIEVPVLPMFYTGQDLSFGGCVALQLIGNHHARHIRQALQQLAEELLRGDCIAPALHQDVQYMAVLVDSPPQVVTRFIDGLEDFIEMPLVPRSGTPAT